MGDSLLNRCFWSLHETEQPQTQQKGILATCATLGRPSCSAEMQIVPAVKWAQSKLQEPLVVAILSLDTGTTLNSKVTFSFNGNPLHGYSQCA